MQLIFKIKDYHLNDYGHSVGLFSSKEMAYIGTQQYLDYLVDDAKIYLDGEKLEEELLFIKEARKKFLPIIANFIPVRGKSEFINYFSIECIPLHNEVKDFFEADSITDLEQVLEGENDD